MKWYFYRESRQWGLHTGEGNLDFDSVPADIMRHSSCTVLLNSEIEVRRKREHKEIEAEQNAQEAKER